MGIGIGIRTEAAGTCPSLFCTNGSSLKVPVHFFADLGPELIGLDNYTINSHDLGQCTYNAWSKLSWLLIGFNVLEFQ